MSKDNECIIPGCPMKRSGIGRTETQRKICNWHLDLKYPHVAKEAGINAVTDTERKAARRTEKEYENYSEQDYEPCKDGRLKYR